MGRETPSSRSSSEGERKQVTVLFADVAGFTSLSEELDPEEVRDLMEPCLDIMTAGVHAYEGTVAQFTGDGIMALFGAPVAFEDAPVRAVRAAIEMRERLSAYSAKLADKAIAFEVRIGLNTGLVVVGSMGSDQAVEYTAIGDTVNLASRMESAALPGSVLVSESTYRLAQGFFEFEPLGELEIKGKKKRVMAYRVLSTKEAKTRMEASLPSGLSPFVGRSDELSRLRECFEKARGGEGQVVGIVGEPGIGKSRLLLQLRELLPEGEYTYLEGGCIHYGEAMAYLPILGILRNYFDIQEGDEEATSKRKMDERLASINGQIAHILPPLQELLSLAVDDQTFLSLEPVQRRERVFEAIRYLLIAASQQRPLILAIEDLHWIDKTSEEFLSYFIEGLPTASVLLLLLYRPEYIPAWVSKTFYSQVRVDHLPEESSTKLVRAVLSEGEVSPEISDFIVEKTAGNPLFIEEMTRGLLEAGSIIKDNEHYVLSTSPSDIQVPDTIQGIIASRLDRLQEELKESLQVASVIGQEFSLRLLEEVTGISKPLKSYLNQMQSTEFIYEKSIFPEPEYIFKHALTQEVAYNSLLLKRRKEIHERIGQAIERLYSDNLDDFYETLAYHFARSENREKALHYLSLSGEKAAMDYSNWEAINYYREAISMLDTLPETEERDGRLLEFSLCLTFPFALLGFPDGCLENLQYAERLAEKLGDEEALMTVYRKFAMYYGAKGNMSLGMEYSEKCFDQAQEVGDVEVMANTAFEIMTPMLFSSRIAEMAAMCERVIELIEEQHRETDILMGPTTIYSFVCGYRGMALALMGEFEEAERVLETGLAKTPKRGGIGFLELHCGSLALSRGEAEDLVDHARKAIEAYEDSGISIFLGHAWCYLGCGYSLLGDHEEAKSCAEKGLELQRESGFPVILPLLDYLSALVYTAAGDLLRAGGCAEEALRVSRGFGSKYLECLSLLALGRAEGAVDQSQVDMAAEHIRQGMSIAEETHMKTPYCQGYIFLGEVFELAGHREQAVENLSKAESMGKEMGMGFQSYWLTRIQEALGRLESES